MTPHATAVTLHALPALSPEDYTALAELYRRGIRANTLRGGGRDLAYIAA